MRLREERLRRTLRGGRRGASVLPRAVPRAWHRRRATSARSTICSGCRRPARTTTSPIPRRSGCAPTICRRLRRPRSACCGTSPTRPARPAAGRRRSTTPPTTPTRSGTRRGAATRRRGSVATDRVANLYPLADFPTGAFLSVIRSTMIAGLPVVHGLTGSAHSEFKVRNSLGRGAGEVERVPADGAVGRAELRAPLPRRGAAQRARISPRCGWSSPRASRCRPRCAPRCKDALARHGRGAGAASARATPSPRCRAGWCNAPSDAPRAERRARPLLSRSRSTPRPAAACRTARAACSRSRICTAAARCCCAIWSATSSRCRASRARICGRIGERVVATPRRTGNLVKCRGMLVNTDVVLEMLSALDGIGRVPDRVPARGRAGRDGRDGDPHRARRTDAALARGR